MTESITWRAVAATAVLNVIASMAFLVLPTYLAGAQQTLHFDARDIGFLSAIGMAGSMLSAICAKYWVRRAPWPAATRLCLLALLLINALSLVLHDRPAFMALQFVAGIFSGSAYSLTLIVLSDTRHPDRNFGYAVAAQVVFQVAGLLAGPALLRHGGINTLLWCFILFCVPGLWLAKFLPSRGRDVPAKTTFGAMLQARTLFALLGCLFFLLNTACYWTYVQSIAVQAGLGEWQIASGLAIGTAAGAPGALLASWSADRCNRIGPLGLGTALILLAAWLLVGPMSLAQFIASSVLFNFAWNYSLAYQYAAVNAADPTGHGVALTPAFHTAGAAAGPALAAVLITPGNYSSVLWVVNIAVAISMACFVASSLSGAAAPSNRRVA